MKAVGYTRALPISDPHALIDIELPEPVPGPHDICVAVRAISVNPVDTKVRQRAGSEPGETRVLGWDVAGVVRAVGGQVTRFSVGDEVFYAGSIARPGANAVITSYSIHYTKLYETRRGCRR